MLPPDGSAGTAAKVARRNSVAMSMTYYNLPTVIGKVAVNIQAAPIETASGPDQGSSCVRTAGVAARAGTRATGPTPPAVVSADQRLVLDPVSRGWRWRELIVCGGRLAPAAESRWS